MSDPLMEVQIEEARAVAAKEGDLQVWWIPQVPGKPFVVPVANPTEAKKVMSVLTNYDIFQFENRIKPDYCNAGGLSVFEDGEWTDWADENGNDIDHPRVFLT